MSIPRINIVAIGSAAGLALFWGWQPLVDLFTGTYNENLNIQISSEVINTCQAEKLLVLHVQPENKGNIPVEIGGKKGGSMVVTVKRLPAPLQKDQWIEPSKLPVVGQMDILKSHPEGYMLERNVSYDEVESITLQPGIYWAGAVVTFPDGDYVDQSIIVKVDDEDCSKSDKSESKNSSKNAVGRGH
jgi:hypothetical protein